METIVNQITLCGTLAAAPTLSHENHGTKFYTFPLEVARLSGALDTLQIIAPEQIMEQCDPFCGERLLVSGQVRSFNRRTPGGRKLIISVFAESIATCSADPTNEVYLNGVICKEPVFRRTPLGREICDIMLAVNRHYRRTDYLPCIIWGRTAEAVSALPVGTSLSITGRLQSRTYIKQLPEGPEERVAYEISALYACPYEPE